MTFLVIDMKLLLKDVYGQSVCVSVHENDTFSDLKTRIAKEDNVDIDIEDFRVNDQPFNYSYNVFEYFKGAHEKDQVLDNAESTNKEWVCSALNCTNSSSNTPSKSAFKFPSDQERCFDWVKAIDREDLLQESVDHLVEHYAICEDHFENGNLKSVEDDLLPQAVAEENEQENELSIFLCRLCAQSYQSNELIDVFQMMNEIEICLPLKIETTDLLSKLVCSSCCGKVKVFKEFVLSCLEAEKKQKEQLPHQVEESVVFIHLDNEKDQSFETSEHAADYNEAGKDAGCFNQNKENEDVDVENETDVFCSVCQKKVPLLTCLNGKCHDTNIFPCFLCDLVLENSQDLKEHLKVHMFVINGLSNVDKTFILWNCGKCGVEFKDIALFEKHMNCHGPNNTKKWTKGGVFKCPICAKTYYHKARLRFHFRLHMSEGQAGKCFVCDKEFSSEDHLYKHLMHNHTERKIYSCTRCEKTFRNQSSLKYHSRSHESLEAMRPFVCDLCQKRFARKNLLRDHIVNIHGSKVKPKPRTCYTCRVCNEAFPNTASAISHMDIHHRDHVGEGEAYSFDMVTVDQLLSCEFCDRCFSRMFQLIEHRLSHMPTRRYQCKVCNEEFETCIELRMHQSTHVADGINDYKFEFRVPVFFVCEFCEKCLKSYPILTTHHKTHVSETPYRCRFCPQTFGNYVDNANHRLTSHDQSNSSEPDVLKPWKCQYCSKTFVSEAPFTKHLRIHTGERPFRCKQCNKSFVQSSHLTTHLKVHSNERPYQCDLCYKSFKIIYDYKNHVRNHSGVRPYQCKICSKTYTTASAHTQHKKSHSAIPEFSCDICGHNFRRKQYLKMHKIKQHPT